MAGAADKVAAVVEKLRREEDVEDVEDGAAAAKTRLRTPTEADRPAACATEAVGRWGMRSCLDAVRRLRVTADIWAVGLRLGFWSCTMQLSN